MPNDYASYLANFSQLRTDLETTDFAAAFDSYEKLPADNRLLLADAFFRCAFTESADDAASQTVADVLADVCTDPGLTEQVLTDPSRSSTPVPSLPDRCGTLLSPDRSCDTHLYYSCTITGDLGIEYFATCPTCGTVYTAQPDRWDLHTSER